MNPTALIPLTQASDLREDRVGQLVKRVLDGVASDETRRAYRHALEMFLAFCGPGSGEPKWILQTWIGHGMCAHNLRAINDVFLRSHDRDY